MKDPSLVLDPLNEFLGLEEGGHVPETQSFTADVEKRDAVVSAFKVSSVQYRRLLYAERGGMRQHAWLAYGASASCIQLESNAYINRAGRHGRR